MNFRQQLKLSVFALVLIALCLSVACNGSNAASQKEAAAQQQAQQPQIIDVTTAAAITRELPRFIEATGSLVADEQTDVASNIAGRVVAVGVDLGDYVGRGATLVRLDDADARLRLTQLQAQAEGARSAVRQTEARIGLRPGQAFDPTRVPEVGAARATLDLAEKNLRRYEQLIESGDVSRAAYDQQRAQRDQSREQYEAQLAAARQNYAGVQTARAAAEASEAQVAQARKAITDAVIYAPISGYVAERTADVGEYVTTSSKLVTLVRTNPLRVRIDIPEQFISLVAPGQAVSVNTSAYADRNFAGRVARISPNVTANSRTLTIEAEVENGQNLLKPGQFATVRIAQPKPEPAILVPARAVRTDVNVSRVFVIKDGRALERVVQPGQPEGELIEIKSGLADGELVATGNVEALSDGALVRQ
ncbi:efflux RND transporter periplasmic adaptor subunit [soil metagenome]